MEIIKDIKTENGISEFQVRLLKNEGVGLLTTQSEDNYLILDSIDYWYDLIQDRYPQKQKCSCKNEWFKIQFQYFFCDNFIDIRKIQIIMTCTNCGKTSIPEFIDIDYSPTNRLIETPIVYCKTPKIKYKYDDLMAFWTKKDLENFLRFMVKELELFAYYWYFKQPEKIRVFENLTLDKAIEIGDGNNFLLIYFSKENLQRENVQKFVDDKGGIYIDKNLWRRQEIIKFSSINIYEIGREYFVTFCNQFIDNDGVKDKSVQFEDYTIRLKKWLKENFTSERGKSCFDGKEGYQNYLKKKDNRMPAPN